MVCSVDMMPALAACAPRRSGQAFRLGRYSLHWHMHGDVGLGQYVRGCAIHHTYNRAVTIHGTHRAVLQDNVAYAVAGHAFFIEVSDLEGWYQAWVGPRHV